MILALDISTSITGYTILDDDKIIICSHIDLRKEKSLFKKAKMISDVLAGIAYRFEISEVYIEQSLQSFRSGFSSAQTLSLLSKINGIVSWICYTVFGKEPNYLAATSARKAVGITVPKGANAKKVVLQFLLDNVPDFKVDYTHAGNPAPGYADRADSYVIAKAGWLNERQKTKDIN
jgi:hypothetical protein